MTPLRDRLLILLPCVLLSLAQAGVAAGQTVAADEDDAAPQAVEPDFAIINLPTTLRLPRHKGSFRLTHRFQGNLRQESFSRQAGNLFGLDNGAAIGLEFRFAVARHVQAAVYRTNIDKTLQFHGKFDPVRQSAATPVSVSALLSVEGRDNFQENRVPAVGAVISRTVGGTAALYAVPMWVHNSAASSGAVRNTALLGLGGRLRVRPNMFLAGEISPRVAGFKAGQREFGLAFEGRAGGHVFQLNVSNAHGTTFGQTAAGGFPEALFLGFTITRKFY